MKVPALFIDESSEFILNNGTLQAVAGLMFLVIPTLSEDT
jgi:hypothetical protein